MTRFALWRLTSLVSLFLLANAIGFTLYLSQPTPACAAGLQVSCGYARIEGKVSTGDTGAGLANASVQIVSATAADYATSASTNANGDYSVDVPVALVGEEFNVSVFPGFSNPRYLRTAEVVPVEVMSGTTKSLNFTLELGAAITGKVESAETSQPLTGTVVTALGYNAALDRYTDEIKATTVDASGVYTLQGLQSGSYVLQYQPQGVNGLHMALYNGGAYSADDAEPVELTAPETIEEDIEIGIGAVVEGFVRRADNDMPVEGVSLELRNLHGERLFFAHSAGNGRFAFGGVPPGQYHVAALPDAFTMLPQDADLLGAFYGDTRGLDDAAIVTVLAEHLDDPANPVTGIDINLPIGATVKGIVRDAAMDTPLADVTVNVSQTFDSQLTQTRSVVRTDANGVYTVTALTPGLAQLSFAKLLYLSLENETSLDLELGEIVTDVDAELNKASEISGRVTDAEGEPLDNIFVRIEDVDDPSTFHETFTNDDGDYSRLVAPGRYTVRFSRNIICGCYNRDYYTTGDDPSKPTPVTVGALAEVDGIDATLACGAAPPPDSEEEGIFIPRLIRARP